MSKSGDDDDLRQDLRLLGSYLISLAEGNRRSFGHDHVAALPLSREEEAHHSFDDTAWLAELAEQEYRERMRRLEHFGPDLFGEPGWDILLDLFVAKSKGRRVSVTSACIAANVPSTTALRWLAILEEKCLVIRAEDVLDKRRTWVELTDHGQQEVASYLKNRGAKPKYHIKAHHIATVHPIPRRS